MPNFGAPVDEAVKDERALRELCIRLNSQLSLKRPGGAVTASISDKQPMLRVSPEASRRPTSIPEGPLGASQGHNSATGQHLTARRSPGPGTRSVLEAMGEIEPLLGKALVTSASNPPCRTFIGRAGTTFSRSSMVLFLVRVGASDRLYQTPERIHNHGLLAITLLLFSCKASWRHPPV